MANVKGKPRGRPFRPGSAGGPGRPKGIPNKATRDIKVFAQKLLSDPDYVTNLRTRLITGQAGAVESLLFAYGYGKPRETVALEGALPKFVVDLLTHDQSGD